MAIMKRATSRNGDFHSFSSRVPTDIYNELSEWAYKNKMTFSAAIGVLIEKSLQAEKTGIYTPYADPCATN